jgi:hypothetical protein
MSKANERAEQLRREAARCLALAQEAWNATLRQELIDMAARFHELANSTDADAHDDGGILEVFNEASKPAVPQQQQQIQPKKDEK